MVLAKKNPNYFLKMSNLQKEEALATHWTPLYSSAQQGISTNRFEACVFGYKGPTVTIFKLADKRTLAIATDQEWRWERAKDFHKLLSTLICGLTEFLQMFFDFADTGWRLQISVNHTQPYKLYSLGISWIYLDWAEKKRIVVSRFPSLPSIDEACKSVACGMSEDYRMQREKQE